MFQRRYSDATASISFIESPASSQTEPPTTPLQKKRLPSSYVSPSQKRLKLIQEALETPSAHDHAQSDEERTSESALSTPRKLKQRFVDIQLALGVTKASTVRITSHTLAQSPSPTPRRIASPQPSVPHGREVGKMSANISTEKTVDEDAELWDCVTPPGIQDVFLGTPVGTVSTQKRSQETIAGPSYSNSRGDEQVRNWLVCSYFRLATDRYLSP
ncbi:hypothetical protein C0993_011181 [Termitomyces sp. T159_Od127]|nr:hypothetical protein C0993_011181 [Termitomyces sp. T159_Od127]